MKILQESFKKAVKKLINPSNIIAEIIEKELEKQDIYLTDEQKAQLRKGVKDRFEEDNFAKESSIQIDDSKLSVTNATGNRNISIDIVKLAEEKIEGFFEKIPDMVIDLAESLSDIYLQDIQKNIPALFREHAENQKEFQKYLKTKWDKALKLFEAYILLTQEIGAEFNDFIRSDMVNVSNPKFEILSRSHARSCQVAFEILILLKNGFADGAHARWRTLHEIAVETNIINKNKEELAIRYLDFESIQEYKSAKTYQKYAEEIHYLSLSDDDLFKLENIYKELIEKYGKDFENENGWAILLVNKKRPKFSDLEEIAQFEHIRPFYKLACMNVHGGPRGLFFRLGLLEHQDTLLAGPSTNGLGEPIQNSAYSLLQITASLLTFKPNLDYLTTLNVLHKIEIELFGIVDNIMNDDFEPVFQKDNINQSIKL
jgi:hypothetical protein